MSLRQGQARGCLKFARGVFAPGNRQVLESGERLLSSTRIALAKVPDHAPESVGFSSFDHLQRR